MHLDHLSFAAGPEGLEGTAARLGAELGADFADGGFHPRFGTRNKILALTAGHYLEVVEVLDHPAADKAPFGQAVRQRTSEGGGWLGWVIAVDEIESAGGAARPHLGDRAAGTDRTGRCWSGNSSGSRVCRRTRSCPSSSAGSAIRASTPRPAGACGAAGHRDRRRPRAGRRVARRLDGEDRQRRRHRLDRPRGPARVWSPPCSAPRAARCGSDGPEATDAASVGLVPVRIRPAVAALPVYRPGKPPPSGPGLVSYKLSSNENPFPPLPGVIAAVEQATAQMNRYPDMANAAMTSAMAARLGVDPRPAGLRDGFGSDPLPPAAGDLRTRRRGGLRLAQLRGVPDRRPADRRDRRQGAARPGLCTISTRCGTPSPRPPGRCCCARPNNPTGPALDQAAVTAFVDQVPEDVLVVLDEAYVEFVTAPGAVRGLDLLAGRPNVACCAPSPRRTGWPASGSVTAWRNRPWRRRSAPAPCPSGSRSRPRPRCRPRWPPSRAAGTGRRTGATARRSWWPGCASSASTYRRAQGNFVWLPAGPRTSTYADAFAAAGVMVRPYVSGDSQDGVRITVGEPEANERVLTVAATLPH